MSTTSAGDVTGPLIKDSRLRKLSFTGSTPITASPEATTTAIARTSATRARVRLST